ncbi:MAG TPA: glutamyl-tRNA reductase [Acidobacteriota bacterium]|jgi:glutamyl-tRNA reductase|nr:glutamyl-tRNA reductase [Acidobacteriota bacterium]
MPSDFKVILVGTNHRMAPVEVREQIAFDAEQMHQALRDVVGGGAVAEAVILSTCNRVEIVAATEERQTAIEHLKNFVARYHGLPVAILERYLYHFSAHEAVRHVFRVASSLDSMVVGETQILGQVKEAFSKACDLGTAGPVLRDLFPRAFRVAKKVRTETQIAASSLSISSIAVELAQKIFERLEGKSILLIGAGKMAQQASRQLVNSGVGRIWVTGRTPERATLLAEKIGGTPLPYQNLIEALVVSDIVIVSTSAPHFVIEQSDMIQVLRQRKNQPVFVIDISVPRNVDPSVNQVDNVFLYDIDDLKTVVEGNRKGRAREAEIAEEIVESEVKSFLRELSVRQSSTVIIELKEKIRRICEEELGRTLPRLPGLPPASEEILQNMAQRIANKISHPFLNQLRENPEETSELLAHILRQSLDED